MTAVRDHRPAIIDLFSGAGGFTWGWVRAGFTPLASVDNDPASARTHELNFSNDHGLSLNKDLLKFAPEDLADLIGHRPRGLVAIIAGPPCQGWSKVGRGKLRSLRGSEVDLLKDPRNRLYRTVLDFVSYFRPRVCVMENVPGMLSLDGADVADDISSHFRGIGYRCSYALVNARWFGVPQDRQRVIFIGTRSDLPAIDASGLGDFALNFRIGLLGLKNETTLARAIRDLPPISHGTFIEPMPYTRGSGRLSRYASIMRHGSNGMITDHISRWHNRQDLSAFGLLTPGMLYDELPAHLKRYRDDIFKDKYKKLAWTRPAWTVTAHFAKDVYTHIHPDQARTISVREAARIQSFPDAFRFVGHMGDRFRMIGNAVPPLMAWGIAEYVKGHLASVARGGSSG